LIKENSYIELTIEIDDEHSDPHASIIAERTVVRYDSERKLPRGIGRLFVRQSNTILQQIANETGKKVLEKVDRSPGHGGVDLSGQEWDRMFIDYLEKEGYTRITADIFSKEFHPEKTRNK